VLRRKQPDRPRSFHTPWVPVVPILSILSCVILMASLPLETWRRFVVWLVIGLCIYFLYSRHHSEFGRAPRTPVDTGSIPLNVHSAS
jgi:APA family basic amino acid/polyamine antiporter